MWWRKLTKTHDAKAAVMEVHKREQEFNPSNDELKKVRKDNHIYQTIYSTLRGS